MAPGGDGFGDGVFSVVQGLDTFRDVVEVLHFVFVARDGGAAFFLCF